MANVEFTTEEWRPVPLPFFAEAYSVSNMGRVMRTRQRGVTWAGRILCASVDRRTGYPRVTLSFGGKQRVTYVHPLVTGAFFGPTPFGKTIDHRYGIKTDNRATELRFLTMSEQATEAYRLGLRHPPHGEAHANARLTDDAVRSIRMLAVTTHHKTIARQFGVTREAVGRVVRRETWKHVL